MYADMGALCLATETISRDTVATVADATEGLPVVCNLFDWLQSAFVETDWHY